LKIPIYYVIDHNYTPHKIITLNNTQKSWGPEEYLNFWCKQGNKEYIKFRHFVLKNQFTVYQGFAWVFPECSTHYRRFREGKYIHDVDFQTEKAINAFCNLREKIRDQAEVRGTDFTRSKTFNRACILFLKNKYVKLEKFNERLRAYTKKIYNFASKEDMVNQLVEIYNFDTRKDRLMISANKNRIKIVPEL
jgi:hypothetical protein